MARRSILARRDGGRVRATHKLSRHMAVRNVKVPTRYKMAADEVIAVIKKHIRKTMGDWMENNAVVHAANGFFFIKLPYRRPINHVEDNFWRATFRQGVKLRRHSIGLALRAMHGEVLTD